MDDSRDVIEEFIKNNITKQLFKNSTNIRGVNYNLTKEHFHVLVDLAKFEVSISPNYNLADSALAGHVIGSFLSDIRKVNDKRSFMEKFISIDDNVKTLVKRIKNVQPQEKINTSIRTVLGQDPQLIKASTLIDLVEGINRSLDKDSQINLPQNVLFVV